MFVVEDINKDYTKITNDASFNLTNCIIKETFFKDKYYIVFEYPDDFKNILQIFQTELKKHNVVCNIPQQYIRCKCIYRYTKFETKFKKNERSIIFEDVHPGNKATLTLRFTGVYKNIMQFVLKQCIIV